MKTCFNEATTKKSISLMQNLIFCEKAGFDYIEIWLCQLDEFLKTHKLVELTDFFAKNHIKPFALDSFEDILFHADYKQLKICFEKACVLGNAIGCDKIVMVPTIHEGINELYTKEQITDESVQVLAELAEIAHPYGMKLAFEPIGFNCCAVRSIAHATEIIERVGLDNVGLTLDIFNNYLYDMLKDLSDIRKIPAEKIFVFHIDDAKKKPLNAYLLDHSDRIAPGDGDLPCVEMIREVAATGYNQAASIELFNDEYYSMDAEQAVRKAYEATKKLIEKI